ncbi:MAG: TauD/TfdA dioxygenase family protein [Hyphomicrobiaceae bacterium]
MASADLKIQPLATASFGALVTPGDGTAALTCDALVTAGPTLRKQLNDAGGLMVVRGIEDLRQTPDAFVRISELFGPEVENVRATLTAERFFHESVPEVMVLSNEPPCRHPPPPRPEPSHTADGSLVVSYPHQTNWHTDQSYRRPPPDITLLYAITTPPADQGQTLFADCTAAYATLDDATKARIEHLDGIHAMSWIGRREQDVRNGVTPQTLLPHQLPQRQPLVRTHPAAGQRSLYLCASGQMDFVDGPIAGLEPGPDGEGAVLIDMLMTHVTRAEFVYAHEWQPGDLVIGDNRCLLHAATWYDADTHARLMWRTTVMGNPGDAYCGETASWVPKDGVALMQGMENA